MIHQEGARRDKGSIFRGLIPNTHWLESHKPLTPQTILCLVWCVCVCATSKQWDWYTTPAGLRAHIFVSNQHIGLYASTTNTHVRTYIHKHTNPFASPSSDCAACCGEIRALSPWKPGQYKSTTVYVCYFCSYVYMRECVWDQGLHRFHTFGCQRGGRHAELYYTIINIHESCMSLQ